MEKDLRQDEDCVHVLSRMTTLRDGKQRERHLAEKMRHIYRI